MKKSAFFVVIILICNMVMFAGCNSNEPAAEQSDKGQTSSSQGGDDVQKTNNDIVVNLPSNGNVSGWEAVAASYMAIHPEVNVIIDLKPQDEYGTWVRTQLDADETKADLVANAQVSSNYSQKTINYLEYINAESPYSGKKWTEQFDISTQNIDLAKGEWNVLSTETVKSMWFYNKDMFREVGLDPEKTPETWDELLEICEVFHQNGVETVVGNSGAFDTFAFNNVGWLFRMYLDQYNRDNITKYRAQEGDWNYDPEIDGNFVYDPFDYHFDDPMNVTLNDARVMKAVRDGEFRADSDEFRELMTNIKKLFPKYGGGDDWWAMFDPRDYFFREISPIIIDATWTLGHIDKHFGEFEEEKKKAEEAGEDFPYERFEWGIFQNPSMEGDLVDGPVRTINVPNGDIYAIKKDTAHNDLVMDFIMYFTSKEGAEAYIKGNVEGGGFILGPTVVYDVEYPGTLKEAFANLGEDRGNMQGESKVGSFFAMAYDKMVIQSVRDWYIYSRDYMTDEITIDEWLDKHQESLEKYLDTALKNSQLKPEDLDHPELEPNLD